VQVEERRDKDLYNLLVTAVDDQWKKRAYELDRGRCVNEYTDDDVIKKYGALGKEAIDILMTTPCLFAYETQKPRTPDARVGWLTKIKPSATMVRIEYEIEKRLPAVTARRIEKLKPELDITNWELNRTHWAVKDVNLIQVLTTAGVLDEAKIRSLGPDSKMVRYGLLTPVTELQVRPHVFRVPNAKIEADLVSVMMPFDAGFAKVYEAIGKACMGCDLRHQRADDIWDEAEVIQDVFSLIYRSRVVVCDFSKRNPNVFYEAGIAHTLGKPVIPIVQNPEDIPFDLRHIRFIKYHDNGEGREKLKRDIEQKLRSIIG
jgi:hypothetical protein